MYDIRAYIELFWAWASVPTVIPRRLLACSCQPFPVAFPFDPHLCYSYSIQTCIGGIFLALPEEYGSHMTKAVYESCDACMRFGASIKARHLHTVTLLVNREDASASSYRKPAHRKRQ